MKLITYFLGTLITILIMTQQISEARVNFDETGRDHTSAFNSIYSCYNRYPHGSAQNFFVSRSRHYRQCQGYFLSSSEISKLQGFRYILVSGMQYEILTALTHYLPASIRRLVGRVESSVAFPTQERILSRLGILKQKFDLSAMPPENFMKRTMLRNAVINSDRCVVMMGHSKGGVDILDLLVHLAETRDYSTLSKVKGFLPIQSPLQGTPHADLLDFPGTIPDPRSGGTTTIRSILNNMDYLSTSTRRAWMASHRSELNYINQNISTIAVGSYIHTYQTAFNSILAIMMRPIYWISRENNDGLVAYRGSRLPGAGKITLAGIDHVSTAMAMPIPQTRFDQEAFTYALLKLQVAELTSCR